MSSGGPQKLQSDPSKVAAPIAEPHTVGLGEVTGLVVMNEGTRSETEGSRDASVGEGDLSGLNDAAVSTTKGSA